MKTNYTYKSANGSEYNILTCDLTKRYLPVIFRYKKAHIWGKGTCSEKMYNYCFSL